MKGLPCPARTLALNGLLSNCPQELCIVSVDNMSKLIQDQHGGMAKSMSQLALQQTHTLQQLATQQANTLTQMAQTQQVGGAGIVGGQEGGKGKYGQGLK